MIWSKDSRPSKIFFLNYPEYNIVRLGTSTITTKNSLQDHCLVLFIVWYCL